MSRDRDWYERLRERNPWLPPADRVVDAELTYGPPGRRSPIMDLTVRVVLPEEPASTWAGSLPAVPDTDTNLLAGILVNVALAMQLQGDGYREQLLAAGARVRAMAEDGEVWPPPLEVDPARRGALLRQVAGDVVAADVHRSQRNASSAAVWLRNADAKLHGLWLGAR